MRRLTRATAVILSFAMLLSPLTVTAQGSFPSNWASLTPQQQTNWLNAYNNQTLPAYVSPTVPSSPSLWSQFTNLFSAPSPSPAYNPYSAQSPDMYGQQNQYTSTNNALQDYSRLNPSSGTTGGQGWGGPEPAPGSLSGSGSGAGASAGGGSAAGAIAGPAASIGAGAIMNQGGNLLCANVIVNNLCPPCSLPEKASNPAGYNCIPKANQYMCPGSCFDISSATVGMCVAPGKCQAVSAPGLGGIGGGLLSTLGVGVTMSVVGAVVGKLVSGFGAASGGGTNPGASGYGSNPFGSTNPTAQTCTSYRPTSDTAQLSQPCTYYVPASGTSTGTTGTGTTCSAMDQALGLCGGTSTGTTGTGTGTNTCSPTSQALGLCGGTSTTTSATNASVSATPTSGPAPLSVTFTVTDTSTGCTRDAVTLAYGDSSAAVTVFAATTACGARNPATLTHTYATSSSFVARLKNAASGAELSSVSITATAPGTTGGGPIADVTTAALAAAPSSGSAPLSVSIIASDTSPECPHAPIGIRYGDDSAPITLFDGVTSCGQAAQRLTHAYVAPGSYKLELVKAGGAIVRSVTINVSAPTTGTGGTQGQGGVQTTFDADAQPITAGVQSSENQATITSGGAAPAGAPTGDIKLFGAGATISASTKDAQTNTTVSGFVGGNTNSTINDKSVAQRLCVSRPWSSNFLSYVIPPSFFDSLCSWRGYEVGQATSTPVVPTTSTTQTSVKPQVQLTQQPAKTTPASVKPATTTPVLTTPAKIDVWAVPASVPLGSRTSIFWNAEGVESCLITSPDGSFTQNVSGANLRNKGASTVPIIAATTFSMSCLRADGSHVTDFVTVKIAI